ncbi:Hypothetical protein NTJ_01123 [Nesidiocoris tenuis]|uniref:Clp R domain-containing protein n=1 Tax=Nesidiocoris tenuis TaxID=355587 RepID=A0ABN7A7T2_9HEMI|nr:Hypothetical protein NTJ_01123 [Nesidiocoris tenuis]
MTPRYFAVSPACMSSPPTAKVNESRTFFFPFITKACVLAAATPNLARRHQSSTIPLHLVALALRPSAVSALTTTARSSTYATPLKSSTPRSQSSWLNTRFQIAAPRTDPWGQPRETSVLTFPCLNSRSALLLLK